MSVPGHKRKSRTTILMSVKPPKAEVSLSRFDVRYVPLAEVAGETPSVRWVPSAAYASIPVHVAEQFL